MFRNSIILLGLLFLTNPLQSQLSSVQHEPDLNWRTLTTEHFWIHYPSGFENLSYRIGDICEDIYEPICLSLNYYPGRTHVVVHTRADFPGAAVSFSPWRIELSVTEPQGNTFGSGDEWLRIVIIHEFTHIVHLRKHKGLSTLIYPLFGDFRVLLHESVPKWFTEGIATLHETQYTMGGRGRTPFHWMQMAAPIGAKKHWRIENTSYHSRKRAPHTYMRYVSGYYLTYFVYQQYGPHVWAKILDRYSAFPLLGFGYAVKSVTKKTLRQLYDEMLSEFDDSLSNQESFRPMIQVWQQPEIPEDQLSPRWVDQDHLIFYRRSLDDLEELIETDRYGRQQQIVQRVLAKQDNSFTVAKNGIIWAELHPHPRFAATIYSDLKLYNRQTMEVHTLTHNSRTYNPDLSPDESQIVAVQTAIPTTRLVTITLKNGEIIHLLKIPGATLLNPRWSPDGEHVAFAIKDSSNKQNIAVLEAQSGQWYYLYTPNQHHDNNPCWTPDGSFVLFVSDQSGVFNIWAVELATGKRWMVTDSRLGAFTPDVSPKGDELAFTIYSYTGFTVVTMPLDSNRWVYETDVQPSIRSLTFQERDTMNTKSNSQLMLPLHTIAYKPWSQIFRPHAWFPYLLQNENVDAICFFVTSKDALHRHTWQGNFGFARKNLRPLVDLSYIYSGWWPKFLMRTYLYPRQTNETSWLPDRGVEIAMLLPLVLERNVYHTYFQPIIYFKHQALTNSHEKLLLNTRNYRGLQLGFHWVRSGQAPRDIVPHRATLISAFADWSIPAFGSEFNGQQFGNQVQLFFPTPIPHHQIEFFKKYQYRRGNYPYDFYGALPIGYHDDHQKHQLRLRTAYVFPLAYLEFPIRYLPIFVDYLDAALFYDWGASWNDGLGIHPRSSTGVQVTAVSYIFQEVRLRLGTALFYHSDDRKWEVIPILEYKIN